MSARTTWILVALAAVLAAMIFTLAVLSDIPQKGPCDDVDHWACEELNG